MIKELLMGEKGIKMKINCRLTSAWGVLWYSKNRLDGITKHLMYGDDCLPVLFQTRREAREWVNGRYGYIRRRKDLRTEPHGWRLPQVVRVNITPRG